MMNRRPNALDLVAIATLTMMIFLLSALTPAQDHARVALASPGCPAALQACGDPTTHADAGEVRQSKAASLPQRSG